METIGQIVAGIVVGIAISFAVLLGIDLEVARNDYNKNVEQCKPIDGCLFSWNCNKYNDMIEEDCE